MRVFSYIVVVMVLMVNVAAAARPFSKDIWFDESNTSIKVNCIQKEHTGHMWLGTDEGLYKYNGRSFDKVEELREEAITAIATYGDQLYLGLTRGRIGIWNGEQLQALTIKGTRPKETVSSIKVISDNLVIIATVGEGLFVVHNGYSTPYNTESGLSDDYVYTIFSPLPRTLLAATDQGINEITLANGKRVVNQYTTAHGLPDNIVRVIKPINKSGLCWIGTHQKGLALYSAKDHKVWTPRGSNWEWGQINDILPVGEDRAWVCTEDGYLLNVRLHSNDSISVQPYEYPAQKLYKLVMDETGNIWCATNFGLKQVLAEYISGIQLPAPYNLQDVSSAACDKEGELWIAQKNDLYSVSLRDEKPVMKLRYKSANPITQLYCDKKGIIWVGTFGDGLWFSTDRVHFNKVTGIKPLEKETILDINGAEGAMWVAGLNGVEELAVTQNNKLLLVRLHNKSTGIGSDYVYRIFVDSRSRVWMATDGAGVCRYWAGEYTHWDSTRGMNSTVAYNLAEDKQGSVWSGTFNKGLIVYGTDRWSEIGRDNGLLNTKIATLAPTVNGNMLVVHAKGIDEWHPSSESFRHYERRLGVGIDTVSTALNLSATDADGNVYIPYQNGLIRFSAHDYDVDIVPSVHISSLNTFYTKTRTKQADFSHSENHITFEYEGLNYANPELLFYRYKLIGYNEEWIVTRDESVTFPQLPSGNYTFIVQASNNSLFKTYGEDSRSFTIARPFWLQWWFFLLLIGGIWFAVATYIGIRERNLQKLSELEKERMLFEYEHLKSQVNPHFLFNSLNTLTGLIDENQDVAMTYTSQLSDLYRNMLSHKDKDLITLGEEWEILDNYVYIQKSRFGDALKLNVDVPEHLKKTKKVVPMALQMLLENAIKHNVVSQSKPLTVNFLADEHQITISNNIQPKLSKEKGAGLGLANIRKRYAPYTKQHVISNTDNNTFTVSIPLL